MRMCEGSKGSKAGVEGRLQDLAGRSSWIITDEERKAFKHLSNDEEREAFIEQFWLRRNPNPDSSDNEFREEH